MQRLRSWIAVVLFGCLLLLASCDRGRQVFKLPTASDTATSTTSTGQGGSGGDLFTTGGGGSGAAPVCEGACVLNQPAWFQGLSLFWIGPPEEAPPCPDVAPFAGSVGYADLKMEPHTCPSCSCSPAVCALPTAMHVSAATCAEAGGAPSLGWESVEGWEGGCSAEGAFPGGLQCGGGPCAQSLTVAAVPIEPCAPSAQGDAFIPPPSWGTTARECSIGPLSGDGCETGQACVPAAPEGFAICVYRFGDDETVPCPPEYDARRLVVYAGVADGRACEPCACSAQEAADCATFVEAFSDGGCGAPVGSVLVTEEEPACVDLPSGTALGSKSATFIVDEPGSCAPSGGAAGTVAPSAPMTLCCQAAAGAEPAK